MARCPSRCQPSSLFALGTGNAQALARVLKNANIIIIKYQISQQYQFSISDHMDPRCGFKPSSFWDKLHKERIAYYWTDIKMFRDNIFENTTNYHPISLAWL